MANFNFWFVFKSDLRIYAKRQRNKLSEFKRCSMTSFSLLLRLIKKIVSRELGVYTLTWVTWIRRIYTHMGHVNWAYIHSHGSRENLSAVHFSEIWVRHTSNSFEYSVQHSTEIYWWWTLESREETTWILILNHEAVKGVSGKISGSWIQSGVLKRQF